MASVAAALQERGFKVSGSDENVYPPMSNFLQEKGIRAKEGYHAENIPADSDVVVIGNGAREFREIEPVLRPGQMVVDLVRAFGPRTSDGDGYEGICW